MNVTTRMTHAFLNVTNCENILMTQNPCSKKDEMIFMSKVMSNKFVICLLFFSGHPLKKRRNKKNEGKELMKSDFHQLLTSSLVSCSSHYERQNLS